MSRYFVDGGNNHRWENPENWSLVSGGVGGQPVPTFLRNPSCLLSSPNKKYAQHDR